MAACCISRIALRSTPMQLSPQQAVADVWLIPCLWLTPPLNAHTHPFMLSGLVVLVAAARRAWPPRSSTPSRTRRPSCWTSSICCVRPSSVCLTSCWHWRTLWRHWWGRGMCWGVAGWIRVQLCCGCGLMGMRTWTASLCFWDVSSLFSFMMHLCVCTSA